MRIRAVSALLRGVAQSINVGYLNWANELAVERGDLLEHMTGDGVHPRGAGDVVGSEAIREGRDR